MMIDAVHLRAAHDLYTQMERLRDLQNKLVNLTTVDIALFFEGHESIRNVNLTQSYGLTKEALLGLVQGAIEKEIQDQIRSIRQRLHDMGVEVGD